MIARVLGMIAVLWLFARPAAAAEDRIVVHVYGGFGTPERVSVTGRVLVAEPDDDAPNPGGALESLVANLKAFESDEVEGAPVTVRLVGRELKAVTDAEGIFQVEFDKLAPPLAGGAHDVEASAADPDGELPAGTGSGRAYVVAPGTRYAVVSDIDDTIVQSIVTRKLVLLANTFLKNAETSTPVLGKAKLYQLLAAGPGGGETNPVFYLSGSPINLHARLRYYLKLHGFPDGPILLKNMGVGSDADATFDQIGYKVSRIERIVVTFPALPLVCFGDDGEKDPEIYRIVAEKHAGRVKFTGIRIVTDAKPDAPRFAGQTAGPDPFVEARALAKAGMLTADQALEVAKAALGDQPLPTGFTLDSDLPPLKEIPLDAVAVDAQDLWNHFFGFLLRHWKGWALLVVYTLGAAVIGGLVGALAGLIAGILVFLRVRAWGWTRTPWAWYRWVAWLMPVWFVLAFVAGFGWAGANVAAGRQVKKAVLEDRIVQRTLVQLAIVILTTSDQQAKLGDLTEKADKVVDTTAAADARIGRELEERTRAKIAAFLEEKRKGDRFGRWMVLALSRVSVELVRDDPDFPALRAIALLSDEEWTRQLEGGGTGAVEVGYAGLRPILAKIDDKLASYVTGYVWTQAAPAIGLALAAALAPVGLLRAAVALVRRRDS